MRPTTVSAPIVARSRTNAWSPTIEPAPMRAPAKTIACVPTITPSSRTRASSGSREADERAASLGPLPSTAKSPIVQLSPMTTPSWTMT